VPRRKSFAFADGLGEDPGEKFFVLLDKMPDSPNSVVLMVDGRNQSSGSKEQARASSLRASWGDGWGAIYRFPDAGCSTLTGDEVGNRGFVTFLVEGAWPVARPRGCIGSPSRGFCATPGADRLHRLCRDRVVLSYAAPLVSGAMALLRSVGYSPQQQYDVLYFTAAPNGWSINGEINAGAALWR
jgi:hypothetical protein